MLALHLVALYALTHMMTAPIVIPNRVVTVSILLPKNEGILPPPLPVPRITPATPYVIMPPAPKIVVAPAPAVVQTLPAPPAPPAQTMAPPKPLPSGAYLSQLMAHLAAFKHYPYDSGTRAGGIVKVRFTANRGGHVLSCTVVNSSGTVALDKAACDLFRRADPLPAVPGDYPGDILDLVLPISYSYVVR